MIVKHSTLITNRLREIVGLSHFNNSQFRDIVVAKVALEENNIKAALEIMLEIQVKNFEVGLTMDDVTRILNTPVVGGQPETLREMIIPSVKLAK